MAEIALLSSERKLALCNILKANICETILSSPLKLRCSNTHTIKLSPSCLLISGRVVSAVLPAEKPPSSVLRPWPVCEKYLWLSAASSDLGVCSFTLR